MRFADPEGLRHELRVSDAPDAPLAAEHPEIPAEAALQGFDGVRAYASAPERSAPVLERLLEEAAPRGRTRGSCAASCRGGGRIALRRAPARPRGGPAAGHRPPRGMAHDPRRASAVGGGAAWRCRRAPPRASSTGGYFKAIYFREPSGVLFEISDDAPGFTIDAPLEELGSKLILPPRLEPLRERLEATLTRLPDPRASWPAARW